MYSNVTPNVYVFEYFKQNTQQANSAKKDDFYFLLREAPLDAILHTASTSIEYQIDLREYQIYERADITKCVEFNSSSR